MTISQYAEAAAVVFAGAACALCALDTRDRRQQRARTVNAYLDYLAAPGAGPVQSPPVDPTEPIPTLTAGSSALAGRHRPNPGNVATPAGSTR